MKSTSKDRITAAIIGGAIGDALGVPVEFEKRGSYTITDMIGGGTHKQPAGTWSDDTALTLCLIENLAEGGDCETLMGKFSDWQAKGYMTPHGECFDWGYTTWMAIDAFRKGTPAAQCGQTGEDDNGNGSLMRIAPVAFLNRKIDDFNSRLANVEKYSSLTHAHSRSVLGCLIYTEYMRQLFTLGKNEALKATIEICRENISEAKYKNEFPHYERILNGKIGSLNRDDIQSSGYVVHTLEAALWCFLKNDGFKETVLAAVNLGDDTDTVGAVAGSMAGMFYGRSDIPEEWISKLAKCEFIMELCRRTTFH